MNPPLAELVSGFRQSDIRRYSAICATMGGINLSQGACDQPAPDEIKQAAKNAIDADQATYTNLCGTIEFRRAIAAKLGRFNRITADPETEIAVTVGSAGAFACGRCQAAGRGGRGSRPTWVGPHEADRWFKGAIRR